MKTILKSLTIATLFLAATAAQAGILIEPYVGSGTSITTGESGGTEIPTSGDTVSGSSMGARLGYGMLGFHAGIDYDMITFDGEKQTNTGVFVSYKLPIMLRVYAAQVLSATNNDGEKVDGLTATKIGIGFTSLPFVNLNLEYSIQKISVSDPIEMSLNTRVIGFSASLPFDI